jgi:hypothetical protein
MLRPLGQSNSRLLPFPPTHNHSEKAFGSVLGEAVHIFRFFSLVASCSGSPAGVRNDENPGLRLPQLPSHRATTCYLRLSNWETDPNKLRWMPNTRSFVRSPRNPAQRRFSHTGQSYRLASLAQLSCERKRGLPSIISAHGLSRSCDRP